MKEELTEFKTAKLAKEKGFDIPCLAFYSGIKGSGKILFDNNTETSIQTSERCSAPTQALLQKWLRDKFQIEVRIHAEHYSNGTNWNVQALKWDLSLIDDDFIADGCGMYGDNGEYKTYEKALEKGLYEGLKLIK